MILIDMISLTRQKQAAADRKQIEDEEDFPDVPSNGWLLPLIVGDIFVLGLGLSQVLDRNIKNKFVWLHFVWIRRVSVSCPLSLLLFAVPGRLVQLFTNGEPINPTG